MKSFIAELDFWADNATATLHSCRVLLRGSTTSAPLLYIAAVLSFLNFHFCIVPFNPKYAAGMAMDGKVSVTCIMEKRMPSEIQAIIVNVISGFSSPCPFVFLLYV